MKEFEIISSGGVMADHVQIPDDFVPAVEALFDGVSFDMDTAARVIVEIDAAKLRLQSDPDEYRDLLPAERPRGLRQIRTMLDSMRALLVSHPEATVSGLVEG